MRNQTARIGGAVGIGLAVGACSSGSNTTSSPAATGQASGTATLSLASLSGIPGKVLVGSNGRTMYLFEADKSGTSACSGACAANWPPVTVSGTPRAGSGVSQALIGTINRPDGTMQFTYHGHPLYYFTADTAAGTAHGQDVKAFGSEWYVVNASGSKVESS